MNDDFYRRVYEAVGQIPHGRVSTYGDLARRLGRPNGARTVGWAMRYCPAEYPWHRVVNAQGRLMTAERMPDGRLLQQVLLEEEGVVFLEPGKVDLGRYAWTGQDLSPMEGSGADRFARTGCRVPAQGNCPHP